MGDEDGLRFPARKPEIERGLQPVLPPKDDPKPGGEGIGEQQDVGGDNGGQQTGDQ
jgi:hypothetical protein